MSVYEASITNPKKQLEFYKDLSEQLERENKKIKKQLEETNKMIEKCGFVNIEQVMLNYCGLLAQQQEFIKYLEDEKDRLARECSNIYEDSLGHTRLVNEDIFDEINDVLQKYREIIGVSDEKK